MSASLSSLLEQEIIADFQTEPTLNQYVMRQHGYSLRKAGDDVYQEKENLVIITVTAVDDGSFYYGSGFHKIKISIEIRVNPQADGFTGTLIDTLANIVSGRLQGSSSVGALIGREIVFSSPLVQVGLINLLPDVRSESGIERTWIINREFVAAHVSSS